MVWLIMHYLSSQSTSQADLVLKSVVFYLILFVKNVFYV